MSGQVSVERSHFSHRPDLLVCLQRECSCLLDTLELLYADKPALTRIEVGDLYASLRHGGVSMRQLNDAIGKVCGGSRDLDSGITKHELSLLLPELDRRYFIIQGARWEFALLDRNRKGEITEKDALFLFRSVHGRYFVMHSWDTFLKERADRRSKVTWKEIEVPLCDTPDELEFDMLKEKETKAKEERQARERELAKKRQERLVREREKRVQRARMREMEKEREEQLAREQQVAREREEHLMKEREEQLRKEKEAGEMKGKSDVTTSGLEASGEEVRSDSKQETPGVEQAAVDEEVKGQEEGQEVGVENEKHRQLQLRLEQAIRSKDLVELEPAVEAVKKEKPPNCSELLDQAEKLLMKLRAAKNLNDATLSRQLLALEHAIRTVKKGGWEKDLHKEMQQANALLEKLCRLEQRKKAVLELSQRVIAELKSYSNPPPQVHQVMRATFLLLGNSEKETKSWQATQVLIGKTGKGSLKRRVAECSADGITLPVAERALVLLQQFDFLTIQDTSQGCATFHAWAEDIIEEVKERKQGQK